MSRSARPARASSRTRTRGCGSAPRWTRSGRTASTSRCRRPRDPTQTFYTTGSLDFGGEQIDYGHLPQAHTDGDIYVLFRNANVLVAGDVVRLGAFPVIDYCTNGWIGGTITGTQMLYDMADDATRIVPGKGAPLTRAHVKEENAMLLVVRQRMANMMAQGMSAQEMLDAAPAKEYEAQWGDPTLFIRNTWQAISRRPQEMGVNVV